MKTKKLLLILALILPACRDDAVQTRSRSDDAPTRVVHGRGSLYDDGGAITGCADDGTIVTLDGMFFPVAQKWPGTSALADGSVAATWIYLPASSTCDGQPNPPNGHFIIGALPIVPPAAPPTTDRDSLYLMIRGIAVSDNCAGVFDLDNIQAVGGDLSIATAGMNVGWASYGGDVSLSSSMTCTLTMNVQAQPGMYLGSFHGSLKGGISLGGEGDLAGGAMAGGSIHGDGSIGAAAIPPLDASVSAGIDADAGGTDIAMDTPYTDETSYVPGADVQCGDGAGLVPLTLTLTATATRDNVYLTPIVNLDGYDLSFTHAPCP